MRRLTALLVAVDRPGAALAASPAAAQVCDLGANGTFRFLNESSRRAARTPSTRAPRGGERRRARDLPVAGSGDPLPTG